MIIQQSGNYITAGPLTVEDAVLNIISEAAYSTDQTRELRQKTDKCAEFIAAILNTLDDEHILAVMNTVSYAWEIA